jgi:hypothetical protein
LIRSGVYMGPVNLAFAAYGGGTLGRNPFDIMNFLQRIPQNSVPTIWSSMRGNHTLQTLGLIMGLHVRVGNEDSIWGANRERSTSLQQVKGAVALCKQFGRKVASAADARKIMKIGVWYKSVDETLAALGMAPNPVDYSTVRVWETDGKLSRGVVGSDSHPIAACLNAPVGVPVLS